MNQLNQHMFTVKREIIAHILFLPLLPSLSASKFKTGQIPIMSQIISTVLCLSKFKLGHKLFASVEGQKPYMYTISIYNQKKNLILNNKFSDILCAFLKFLSHFVFAEAVAFLVVMSSLLPLHLRQTFLLAKGTPAWEDTVELPHVLPGERKKRNMLLLVFQKVKYHLILACNNVIVHSFVDKLLICFK